MTHVELVQGLGVEVADEELGTVVGVPLVLLEEDRVEVSGGLGLALASESVSAGDVAGEGALGGSVDESLSDQDLGADDDGGGGDQLSVDDGHAADEREGEDGDLHFDEIGFFVFGRGLKRGGRNFVVVTFSRIEVRKEKLSKQAS